MLVAYLLFESLPNAMAEITYYADRQFYVDYWNSLNVEEFIQKLFKLPYIFFYRHSFVRMVVKYKFNIRVARFISFILWTLTLELIFVMGLGIFKFYIFKLLLVALVWHIIQTQVFPSETKFNSLTLFGFLAIVPLICCFYCREYLNMLTH